jgi:hypothetical protein
LIPKGDIAAALRSFRFARLASTNSELQKFAEKWEQNCVQVLGMRKHIDD